MKKIFTVFPALLCFVTGLVFTGVSHAQSTDVSEIPLDCTIEPNMIARIGSPDEGIIAEVKVQRGDVVKKGQVLATLESTTEKLAVDLARLQAKQDVEIRSGRARLGFLRVEKQRAEALSKTSSLSDKLLDEAKMQETIAKLELESARIRRQVAEVELALAESRLDHRTIRSSINGIVTEVTMLPGEYIHEQTPLLTLAEIEDLKVEVFVPVQHYGRIRLGQKVIVEPVQPIGGKYEAEVAVVDRIFDAASGTFGVQLKLANPDGFLPAGIRCMVRFPRNPRTAG